MNAEDNARTAVRVLILTGANNHDWRATTPVLRKLFDGCPRFKVVDVLADPSKITAELLAGCDVVVSNWSAYPAMTGHQWGPAAEKAFVDWIRAGKGFVVFHAASATSQDWPEFQQLVGLSWRLNHTAHGAYSTFKVSIADAQHPVTRGLTDFWTTDELWHNMAPVGESKFHLLAQAFSSVQWSGTGKFEPVLLCTELGQGRGVNLTLGHDVHGMENAGWRTLLLRGAEWAATGQVTLPVPTDWPSTAPAAAVTGIDEDAVIKGVAGWKFGQPCRDLALLQELVIVANSRGPAGAAARQRLVEKMAAVLAGDASPEAKAFFCKQIGGVASAAQVPAVATLLRSEQTSEAGRYALERIPAPEAAAALRDALGGTSGKLRIGIINSLGDLRDRTAVEPLAALAQDADAETAAASKAALVRITGKGN